MWVLAAMSILRVGRALRIEPRNGVGFEFSPAGQEILEEMMSDDLLYGFYGEDYWAVDEVVTEAFFDEGLRVDGLSDANGLGNV